MASKHPNMPAWKPGCFRRLSTRRNVKLSIIGFHTGVMVVTGVIMTLSIVLSVFWHRLLDDLNGLNRNNPDITLDREATTREIEISISTAVAIRFVAVGLGYYSVKTRHSPVFVMGLIALLVVTSILMVVGGITLLAKYDRLSWAEAYLQREMTKMRYGERELPFVDRVQTERHCCGISSYTDWQQMPYGITSLRVPPSCCIPENRFLNQTEDPYCGQNLLPDHPTPERFIYTEPCLEVLTRTILMLLKSLAVITFLLGVTDGALASFGIYLVLKDYV